MGVVEIRVKVPDGMEERFIKIVKEIAKFYNTKNHLFKLLEELKGSIKTDKSWKDLKVEAHEQSFCR
ncbi:conserved protein of unknown function [Methanocaldococcus lauensis]|uniref:Uncharacterized protein n=1 Tax=Methanocaldococcus lauensis TaxID=2546128 RepID=A0A8D6SVF1_9EURY|nr:hypothetical protein [Methanocaldococcus lauensis]CAB3288336.1 conserved protein of unknown function [Methanocaldococcus lauensis]